MNNINFLVYHFWLFSFWWLAPLTFTNRLDQNLWTILFERCIGPKKKKTCLNICFVWDSAHVHTQSYFDCCDRNRQRWSIFGGLQTLVGRPQTIVPKKHIIWIELFLMLFCFVFISPNSGILFCSSVPTDYSLNSHVYIIYIWISSSELKLHLHDNKKQ